jgi:hypothetical protein
MAAPAKYQKMFGAERANKIYKRGLGAYYSSGSRPKMALANLAKGWKNTIMSVIQYNEIINVFLSAR